MKCQFCSKETVNPKFCNSSCSASYNNKLYPRKKPIERVCKHCNAKLIGRKTTCIECNPCIVDWSEVTLKELQEARKYQANSRIRELARSLYRKSDKPKCCTKCNYDKHYEVCHIKAINSFDDNSTITEINDINNLVALCRNCHWELDNGLLTL